jgi:hypothetical protein
MSQPFYFPPSLPFSSAQPFLFSTSTVDKYCQEGLEIQSPRTFRRFAPEVRQSIPFARLPDDSQQSG